VVSLKNRLVPPSRFLRDTTMLRAFSNWFERKTAATSLWPSTSAFAYK
jgi:hypothetical protein